MFQEHTNEKISDDKKGCMSKPNAMGDKERGKGKSSDDIKNHGKSSRTFQTRGGPTEQLSVMQTLFSKCLCSESRGVFSADGNQIELVSLDGIECIALGAVSDEHTAWERVALTVTLLASRTERLVNLGYLKDCPPPNPDKAAGEEGSPPFFKHRVEVVPFEAWKGSASASSTNKGRPPVSDSDSFILPLAVGTVIEHLKENQFDQAIKCLKDILHHEKQNKWSEKNRLLQGLTLHNIGVVYLLKGSFELAYPFFEEAIKVKQTAFGEDHPEVAISLVESGILLFAKEKYDDALWIFNEALKIRIQALGSKHPKVAMVLNNIACVHFEMGNPLNALATFKEARDIEQHNLGCSQNADLDLLHVATTLSNIGYIQLQIKNYEEAGAVLQDALLVQQSVLGDNHKTVKDTLSNLDFANAFHS